MNRRLTVLLLALAAALTLASPARAAQEPGPQHSARPKASDLRAEVPELREFHGVIFKIWHTAWPAKDTAMLRSLLPEIRAGVGRVAAARLPGILRDKAAAWDGAVAELQTIVQAYAQAAGQGQEAALLNAAERLHAQYERLVRLIRPPLKEVEDFHAVLYVLYHDYMPGDSLEQIRSSATRLSEAMTALNAVQLPERFKSREAAFRRARTTLAASVATLVEVTARDAMTPIRNAIGRMHADYQALERVFE